MSTRRQEARRAADSPERAVREAILAATVALWSTHSLGAPPIAVIAERAGVAPGSIYVYFRSKEHLLREAMDELVRDLAGRLSTTLCADSPSALQARFGAVWATLLQFRRDRSGALELLLTQGKGRGARGEAVLAACPGLAQWLREAAADGSLVFRDASEAWALLSMICLAAPLRTVSEAAWGAAAWRALTGMS